MGTERRRHPRHEILAQVKLPYGAITYVLEVGNVSVSGIYIRWTQGPRPPWMKEGRHLEMDLFVPDVATNLRLSGVIVHVHKSESAVGLGVHFDENMPEGSRAGLDRLIAMAADSSQPPPLRGS